MNGFIKTTAAGLVGGAGLVSLAGCHCYRDTVDPCWPERYSTVARYTVRDTMNAQAGNGHVLDQTVWNWQFEADPLTKAGTDKLNAAGVEHLKYLARRRPSPDPKIFLQTAHDLDARVAVDQAAQARSELDARRAAAIQRFMNDTTVGRNLAVAFYVEVHDVADPSISAVPIAGTARQDNVNGAYQKLNKNYQGVLPANGGGGSTGGGGSSGSSVSASVTSSTSSGGSN